MQNDTYVTMYIPQARAGHATTLPRQPYRDNTTATKLPRQHYHTNVTMLCIYLLLLLHLDTETLAFFVFLLAIEALLCCHSVIVAKLNLLQIGFF